MNMMDPRALRTLRLCQEFLEESYTKDLFFILLEPVNNTFVRGVLGSRESLLRIATDPFEAPHTTITIPLSWLPKDNSPVIQPGQAIGLRISRTEDTENGVITLRITQENVTDLAESLNLGGRLAEQMREATPPTATEQ